MAKIKNSDVRFKKSQALFARAVKLMPGGVSSPVRSFRSVGLSPVFIRSGAGAGLTDVDGNKYIDYVMSYGPLIHGHAHPAIRAAVAKQMNRGSSFGCCSESEIELAQLIAGAMPHVPMVRFVNSGTEAVMSAIRLARAATGRAMIVKFAGAYHGHVDALLVGAGSGATTHGHPTSPGVPQNVIADTLVVEFNDLSAMERVFAQHGRGIAAVLVEPVMGNIGVIPPQPGFLAALRQLCDKHESLLIFDEVMTGWRVARGGAQTLLGVRPDITCLGKIIGGGLPVGAYGGPIELLNRVSPAGPVYQAGTLSGNPLSMAAGIASLRLLNSDEPYARLEILGARLEKGLQSAAAAAGVPLAVQRCGSMLTPFFLADQSGAAVHNNSAALRCDTAAFARFFKTMLESGVMIPPSQFEAWFISLAHNEADIDATIEKAAASLAAVRSI
jgi:glutamate-1-semialdehyde 2,1-aminomutase